MTDNTTQTRTSQSGVTQADRDLYADLFKMRGFTDEAGAIRNGEWDDDIGLRSIARHRQSTPLLEAVKDVRADVARAIECGSFRLGAIGEQCLTRALTKLNELIGEE